MILELTKRRFVDPVFTSAEILRGLSAVINDGDRQLACANISELKIGGGTGRDDYRLSVSQIVA